MTTKPKAKKKTTAKKKATAKKAAPKAAQAAAQAAAVGSNPQDPNQGKTMGNMLGEIVWLMTQSAGHKHFALSDLEWMVMPALLLEQYRIFRNGTQPLGVALWAYLGPEAEEKLTTGGRLRPDEWAVGMKLDPKKGAMRQPGGSLWLVDLIAPFHTPDNKMADKMLADLMQGPFKGKKFKFHHTDPKTHERKIMELGGDVKKADETKAE